MSISLLNNLPRDPKKAIAALMAGIGLACASSAQAAPFNPSPDRTPYQVVSNDGRCLQANPGELPRLSLANCNPGENMQKFYVLQDATDADLSLDALGGDDSIARVVLAPTLDAATSAATKYQFVGLSGSYRWASLSEPTGSATDSQRWQIVRYSSQFDNSLKVVAAENSTFHVASRQTVYYGIPGKLIEKSVQAFSFVKDFPCTNAFFGSDPAPGIVKGCYVSAAQQLTTKYNVKLKNVASLKEEVLFRKYPCLSQDQWTPTEVELSVCKKEDTFQDPIKSDFTLRPTSYPM